MSREIPKSSKWRVAFSNKNFPRDKPAGLLFARHNTAMFRYKGLFYSEIVPRRFCGSAFGGMGEPLGDGKLARLYACSLRLQTFFFVT